MKKKFSEAHIIQILKEAEASSAVAEVYRKYSIAPATYDSWKAKFGRMSVSEAQRLKTLEEENKKLKRLVADYALDNLALKDLLSKKW
ncbi:transposase [Candidatus Protochlamydia sp. W-9]|uniref:transposase n=1 Tax=Candidatus Protochlamydia sp. W-9 TaxID=1785087 RepID=UPI00096ABA1A|nr:transposase [Candidatus Protochlamydia sp. W-9]